MNDIFSAAAIKEQKQEFFRKLNNGEELTCPCCRRFAKIYHRQIHAGIALQLIRLYRLGGAD